MIQDSLVKGTLKPFQQEGVEYVISKQRCIIADEMGLGKTIQAIAVMQKLRAYPALVVCPSSLKLNWQKEVNAWVNKKVVVLNGTVVDRIAADVYIINYDILLHWKDYLKSIGFKIIVMDEFHYCKNAKSKRTKAVKEIAYTVTYRLGLSGTPVLNRPFELVSQLDILGKLKTFGGFWGFTKRYCNVQRNKFGYNFSGHMNLEELNRKLRENCYIRRKKIEVLKELPPKQRTYIPMEINNREEYVYAKENIIKWLQQQKCQEKEFLATIKRLPFEEKVNAINKRNHSTAQKAGRAEQLVKIESLKQIAVDGKLPRVTEWIDNFLESGEKLVVFATHINVQKKLLTHYPQAARILGDDNIVKRQQNIDRFMSSTDCPIIICSLLAANMGITLTSASNVAFVELGWTPSIHEQAEDRCHRIGQTQQVNAWYLVANRTIEDDIQLLLEEKLKVTTAIHDGGEAKEVNILNELIRKLEVESEEL